MSDFIVRDALKYKIYDMLKIVDKLGRVYYVKIIGTVNYNIAKLKENIDIIAQQFSGDDSIIDKTSDIFYICEDLNIGNIPSFISKTRVLWDRIIDHENTSYLVQKSSYQMDIVPLPNNTTGTIRSVDMILNHIKGLINGTITTPIIDANISFTDITEENQNELARLRKAVDIAFNLIDELKTIELLVPLINAAKSIDFEKVTTEFTNYLANIQARLNMVNAEGVDETF